MLDGGVCVECLSLKGCVEHSWVEQHHHLVHDSQWLSDHVEVMLELVHDLLDFILSVYFDLKIVTSVSQIGRHNEEPFVDLIKRNSDFEVLVWSFPVLFVLTHWDGHLPYIMWLIWKLNIRGRSLLRAARALRLYYILLHWVDWSFIDATGWLSPWATFLRLCTASRVRSGYLNFPRVVQGLINVGGCGRIHRLRQ